MIPTHRLWLKESGSPLPPYVKRPADSADEERYQTVYADNDKKSAVAAPTAGLHFTPEILKKCKRMDIYSRSHFVRWTGTFRPIETEKVEDHPMHAEEYFLSPETKIILRDHSTQKLAIGTTCVRAIEHYLGQKDTHPDQPTQDEAQLFIRPLLLSWVDHLLTNFHLPGSTLLCSVGAFLTPGKRMELPA